MSDERTEAIQNVVDRVSSYQDGAPEGTVEKELRSAVDETDLDLTDDEIDQLTRAIEDHGGDVNVSEVLGQG